MSKPFRDAYELLYAYEDAERSIATRQQMLDEAVNEKVGLAQRIKKLLACHPEGLELNNTVYKLTTQGSIFTFPRPTSAYNIKLEADDEPTQPDETSGAPAYAPAVISPPDADDDNGTDITPDDDDAGEPSSDTDEFTANIDRDFRLVKIS